MMIPMQLIAHKAAAVAWPQLVQDDAKVQASEPCLLVTISLQNAGAAAVGRDGRLLGCRGWRRRGGSA